MSWFELLGLAVLAAVITVIVSILFFRGAYIYKWCRRGCRPKKSKSRRKVRPVAPSVNSSEHLLDENNELNLIKAENKRISKAIDKINEQENERLREQLRKIERAKDVEPLYASEYPRVHDSFHQPGPRRLIEPRRDPYLRRSSFVETDDHYKEPMRPTRFTEQERPVRKNREIEQAERFNNQPSKPVKSNLITDQRRKYARKKSTTGVRLADEEFDRVDETDQRQHNEDQSNTVRGSINQPLDRKTYKPKEPESDLSDY